MNDFKIISSIKKVLQKISRSVTDEDPEDEIDAIKETFKSTATPKPKFQFPRVHLPKIGKNGMATNTSVASEEAVAVGYSSKAEGKRSIAHGAFAKSQGDHSIALGPNAEAMAATAIVVGLAAAALAINSISIGQNAKAFSENAMALGFNSSATGINSIALGAHSKTSDDNQLGLPGSFLRNGPPTAVTHHVILNFDGVLYKLPVSPI